MEIVAQSPFAWTLFQQDDGQKVLSVLCGRVGQYSVEIPLTPAESSEHGRAGLEAIEVLAKDVSAHPATYAGRALQGFFSEEAFAAIEQWKRRSSQVG